MNDRHDAAGLGRLVAMSNVAYSITTEATTAGPIYPYPVALERPFRPFDVQQTFRRTDTMIPVRGMPRQSCVRCLHFAPGDVDLARATQALRGMAGVQGVVGFECYLRKGRARFYLVAEEHDLTTVTAGLRSVSPSLAVVDTDDPRDSLPPVRVLYDVYSSEPYHRAVRGLHTGIWQSLFSLSPMLDLNEECWYEVRFVRTRHPWQRNMAGLSLAERSLGHRSPHGQSVALKALDEPLFAAVVRLGSSSTVVAPLLASFVGTFMVDGIPLRYRTLDDFHRVLGADGVQQMLQRRATHTTGQFLTAPELSLFVQPPDHNAAGLVHLDVVSGLPVPPRLTGCGIPLGVNSSRGAPVRVVQPLVQPNKSCWLVGRSRSGKSLSLLHRCRFLAVQGHGVIVLDPHRTLALDLLGVLGEVDPERVIVLDFDDLVPVAYNPLAHAHPEEYGRLTSEYQHSLKHLFGTDNMHRTTHFLGNAIYACLVLPEANLATIPSLFSKTPLGERLRQRVIASAVNPEVRRFWQEEFPTHRQDAFAVINNRLSAMLLDDRTRQTFSQQENRVDIGAWMDEGKVVIIAPPRSNEPAGILGGCLIAQARQAAFRRAGTPRANQHCHLVVDEWHRFITSAATVESIIHETSKGGLSVVLANQDTGQLPSDLLKATLSIPNIFVYGVGLPDARMLAHLFNGHVTPETLSSQGTGSVFARIDQDIVHYTTPPPVTPDESLAARLKDRSRQYHSDVRVVEGSRARRRIEPLEE